MLPFYRIYCLLFALCLTLSTTFAQSPDPATTRYVSTTGTNTDPASATSWATSTSDLQGAINSLSATGGEVWVAAGTYKPTATADRTVSFSMKNGVAIYGGFVGNEITLNNRPSVNPNTGLSLPSSSTLSGDIDNDGLLDDDNSYHVFWNEALNATAILDGFVITGGNANDPERSTNRNGGGMYNKGDGTNCNPTLRNCLFLENIARELGGGIYNSGNASPTFVNCQFKNNTAILGGAIYNASQNSSTNHIVTNCLFDSNTATEEGGGIYSNGENGSCTVLLTNCSFQGNTSKQGGGISTSNGSLTTINCSFQGNSATSRGGALFTIVATSTLLNCVFWNNGGTQSIRSDENASTTASYSLFDTSTGYTATNSLITNTSPFASTTSTQLNATSPGIDAGDPSTNPATGTPAAVGTTDLAGVNRFYSDGRVDMGAYEYQDIILADILQQPASRSVGCLGGQVTIAVSATGTNISYRWYKDGPSGVPVFLTGVASATTATLTLTNLTMASAGSYSVVVSGAYNSVTSTAFTLTVNASPTISISATPVNLIINSLESATLTASGATSGYTWSTGQTSATIVVNADATYSVTGVSDGCYGVASAVLTVTATCNSIIHVTPGGGVSVRDGNSWATAFAGIQLQQAINRADFCGAQVWIASGTYKPTSNTAETNVSFSMKNGVSIYGGFVGNETVLSQRPPINPVAGQHSNTILSGDIDGDGTPARNSQHVFRHSSLNSTAVMDGVVITAAYSSDGTGENKRGAGMVNLGSSPTLTNCTFQSNTTLSDGGAMYNKGSTPKLTNCVFDNNYGDRGGAITWSLGGGIEMTSCVLQNNKASQEGGVFFVLGGTATLTNCLLQNNHADGKGGVAYGTSTFLATNCVFRTNTSAEGGVFWSYSNRTTLTNCTVQGNRSMGSGGFMYSLAGAVTVLTNSILWDNSDNKGEVFYDNNTPPLVTATYCLFDADAFVSDPTNLSTSISPFVSTTSSELRACSPAIDAGNPATTSATVGTTDLAGNNRFYNSRVDMGAYEAQSSLVVAIVDETLVEGPVCPGGTANPSVSVTGAVIIYQWYNNGTAVAGQNTAELSLTNVQPEDAGNYVVVVTGACNSVTSTVFNVTVNLAVTAMISPGSATLTCLSPTLTLTATGAMAEGEFSYRWDDNSEGMTRTVSQAGTYSVIVTAATGCTASSSVRIEWDNSNPTGVSLMASSSAVCEGGTVSIPATATGNVSTYQWFKDGITLVSNGQPQLTLSNVGPAQSGNYVVVVTGACGSATSTAFNLTVKPAPIVSLVLLNNRKVLQVQSGVLYERLIVIDRVNGYEIRQTDSSTTGFFPVNRPGPFRMTVTGANGCKTVVESSTDSL